MSHNIFNFQNKQIVVLGYGVEGQSVVGYLLSHGVKHITVYDEKLTDKHVALFKPETYHPHKVSFVFGPFPKIIDTDGIIFSPGIRPDIPLLTFARKNHIPTTTATNIFFSRCPCPIIGVTGTKGKGTTSTLIFEILKKEGKDVHLGGNIGIAPLSFLDTLTKKSLVVLELSSFQLFTLKQSPHIAVVVMVTCDHLDYHKDEREYVEAKAKITQYQQPTDLVVYNIDYPNTVAIGKAGEAQMYQVSGKQILSSGAFIKDGYVHLVNKKYDIPVVAVEKIFIPGKHNWENVCAAAMATQIAGASPEAMKEVFETFRGLPHRLQLVGQVSGVRYYDDSFSTTPDTACAAIEAFRQPKVLILGGSSKGSDFTMLGKVIAESDSIRAIIGIGIEWPKIKETIPSVLWKRIQCIEGCQTMEAIVNKASEVAGKGDVVVLSPACASFDMFKNYKDRGDQFIQQVQKLCGNS